MRKFRLKLTRFFVGLAIVAMPVAAGATRTFISLCELDDELCKLIRERDAA